MGFHSFCCAFESLQGSLSVNDGVVFLQLGSKARGMTLSLALHPMQALTLAESLTAIAGQVPVDELPEGTISGDLMMEFPIEEKAEDRGNVVYLDERPVA